MAGADDRLIEIAGRYSKSTKERLAAMAAAVRRIDAEGIEGDIVECGIWLGGNIILARKLSPQRTCWLYDTFSGMPEPGPFDVKRSGVRAIDRYAGKIGKWTAASIDEVRRALKETETLDEARVRFIEGRVEDTLKDQANIPDKIALLRLDTDWHASTKVELEVLYPLLVPGGILIVDDYGHWQGARKAVDDYFAGCGPTMQPIDYTAVMMVKPC